MLYWSNFTVKTKKHVKKITNLHLFFSDFCRYFSDPKVCLKIHAKTSEYSSPASRRTCFFRGSFLD